MWEIVFIKQADKDKKKLKATELDKKAKSLIEAVRSDPFARPPAFEPLKGNLEGAYSRRISLQHRFVCEAIGDPHESKGKSYEGYVKVISMWIHYENVR